MKVECSGSCGVSVPGLRFVDAANGVLGIEWVNGKSVRYLLGSRDEGEEGDQEEDEEEGENATAVDEDPLAEYAISKGTFSHSCLF
jgi:TP53 regulating kinase-like protein